MSHFNRDILIQNVNKLLADNNMSQKQLGEIIGMSQPNVNHALNPNQKKCFTLDQITSIAEHFHVSLDELILGKKHMEVSARPRATAAFLATLLEKNAIKVFDHNVEEEIFEVDYVGEGFQMFPSCERKNEVITYKAFFLPSYWEVPHHQYTEEEAMAIAEATQIGNDTAMKSVNDFLHHYLGILNAYRSGSLTEDTYRTVLADLLSHLRQ